MEAHHENGTFDVFISHRSLYKDWVITLANNLRKRGYEIWLDSEQLVPGRNFSPGLHNGLKSSRKAVLVASPDVIDSGWVREEYEAMLIRKQRDPGFSVVPLVFGHISDLPFLENVQCVDFRDPSPAAYRRAFYRLLCGLEDKPPGPNERLKGKLEIPKPIVQASQPVQGSEQAFLEKKVSGNLRSGILMLLAQAGRDQGGVIQAILEHAQRRFEESNTLHVMPPYNREAELADYFTSLGRRCRLSQSTNGSLQWENALDQRLEQLEMGKRLFLLISGFENGSEPGRRELNDPRQSRGLIR